LISALIGQMAQSVVIGLLYSDWSDGSICYDWYTLLWSTAYSECLKCHLGVYAPKMGPTERG